MKQMDLMRDLLNTVDEFDQQELWQRFTNYDCFGVRIAGQEERLLGVILGNAGQEYGLSLFRGPRVVASLAGLLDPEGPGDDAVDDLDMIGFSIEPFESLPPEAQALLSENGRTPDRRDQVPNLLAKPSGCQGRLPNESELSLLLLVIKAVVEADKNHSLKAATLDDDEGICILNIAGDERAPHVSVTQERWEQETAPATIPLFSAGQDLAHLPRLHVTWLVGLPALPAALEGDDRAMQMLLVVDEASELILQGRPVFAGQTTEAATILVDTFQGKGMTGVKGLPGTIVCSSPKTSVLFGAATTSDGWFRGAGIPPAGPGGRWAGRVRVVDVPWIPPCSPVPKARHVTTSVP